MAIRQDGIMVCFFALVTALAAVMVCGCAAAEKNGGGITMEEVLLFLERGRAQGSLVVTSDGTAGVYQTTKFGFGAGGSLVSFTGEIDYSKAGDARLQVEPVPTDQVPAENDAVSAGAKQSDGSEAAQSVEQ